MLHDHVDLEQLIRNPKRAHVGRCLIASVVSADRLCEVNYGYWPVRVVGKHVLDDAQLLETLDLDARLVQGDAARGLDECFAKA